MIMGNFDVLGIALSIAGVGYCGSLVIAALTDIVKYRIPNAIVIFLCVAFVATAIGTHADLWFWLWHFLGFLTAFAFGILAWHVRLMGGGDIKLIAALGLWTGLYLLPVLLIVIALAGGGVTVVLLIVRAGAQRCLARPARLPPILRRGEPVPYGVAIALGGLLVMPEIPMLAPLFSGL